MCPVKEPNFLAYDDASSRAYASSKRQDGIVHAKTFPDYLKLFDGVVNEKAIGEASVSNFSRRACDQASIYLPHARLIIIFRHPIDRAHAEFQHRRQEGYEPESSFLNAYRASSWRWQNNWGGELCYKNPYVFILKHWLSRFPHNQFRFYLTDDLKLDPLSVMQDIFRFLEVDDSFKPDVSARHNTGFSVRSRRLSRFMHPYSRSNAIRVFLKMLVPQPVTGKLVKHLKRWNRVPVEPLDPELRHQLTNELRDDILKLQDLIGRDLSLWFEEPNNRRSASAL
jgi:hypothetical protein